ncbi:MAG: flagellar basal body P-ring formation protein FlgA [Deltaproteobacteria bacterium]|nr:flagellar basal body P-ring formation protein FlgA [Deltaproteobacteria bacterium]
MRAGKKAVSWGGGVVARAAVFSATVACLMFFAVSLCAAFEAAGGFPVVVATRPLSINHIVSAEDVRMSERASRDLRDASYLNEVIGKRLIRPIGADVAVKKDYLRADRAVKRGDAVVLVAEKGNLKAFAKAVAREDGAMGDVLRVENASSGRIISGRLIEPGVVAVDF